MDVITRTTFHLQVRNRSGTDDQTETGPDRVGTNSGSEPTSETCAPDSMSFNEFHFLDEFHITRCRTKVSGIVAHSTTRYAAWATLLGAESLSKIRNFLAFVPSAELVNVF